ncbi:lipopolysaccharide biosynthesis protein [Acinetobacter bereziniae]|uniref:lipopolysaccharide biosynthesis protein n=1 Tax=Acinetobacter bereziniae TaxID=106648 RepID=UPI003AF8BC66
MSNFFSNILLRNFFKYLYKISHSKSFNHNRRYWPYFYVERNKLGYLDKVFYKKRLISDNTKWHEPINDTCVIVATGPSINEIDEVFFKNQKYDYFGLNGAISLADTNFKYYVIIDHDFIENRFKLVTQILKNKECIFFTTPRCLELILRKYLSKEIQCTLKIIETITEKKLERFMGPKIILTQPLSNSDLIENSHIGFSTEIFNAVYDYYTVAYVALQIAYALNYKRILITGLDMSNFTQPRFYETIENKQPTRLEQDFEAISLAFEAAASFLKKNKVQVINLSPNSSVQAFEKDSFQHFI